MPELPDGDPIWWEEVERLLRGRGDGQQHRRFRERLLERAVRDRRLWRTGGPRGGRPPEDDRSAEELARALGVDAERVRAVRQRGRERAQQARERRSEE